MFQWLANLFKSDADRIEERLLKLFDFLLRDHGFAYAKEELGDAVDKNGKFVFYGPMIAYQFYKDKICISILHLAQRDEYNVYITGEKSADQVYIINGTTVPSCLAYDLTLFAQEVEESILNCGELYGYKI